MIKLGVVGHGRRVSSVINDCIRPLAPDLRVAAIVDPDRESALSRLPEEDRSDVVFYETLPEMVKKEKPRRPRHRHPLPPPHPLRHPGGPVRPAPVPRKAGRHQHGAGGQPRKGLPEQPLQ